MRVIERVRLCGLFGTAVAILLAVGAGSVAAQEGEGFPERSAPPPREGEDLPEEGEEELRELLLLILPQQKEHLRELIRKYPDTRTARIARRLLDEYGAYDQLAAQETAVREPWRQFVLHYWKSRTEHIIAPWHRPAVRIVNATDEPVLFQAKLPLMEFVGPYRMAAGQEQLVFLPVVVRYVTAGSFRVQKLVPGHSYAFHATGDGQVHLVPEPPAVQHEGGPPADGGPSPPVELAPPPYPVAP